MKFLQVYFNSLDYGTLSVRINIRFKKLHYHRGTVPASLCLRNAAPHARETLVTRLEDDAIIRKVRIGG